MVFGPDDGAITVPRHTTHGFGRADADPHGQDTRDVELRIQEWTAPPDGFKEAFFRNVIGVINDKQGGILGGIQFGLDLFGVLWKYDTYPVLWRGPEVFGERAQLAARRWVTRSIMGLMVVVGKLWGVQSSHEEYMPDELMAELKGR